MKDVFLVPVRTSATGAVTPRTGRLLSGERVGLAFTSEASLLLTLGPSQEWIRLGCEALKGMLTPLGIRDVRIDPHPAAELAVAAPISEPRIERRPAPVRFRPRSHYAEV